MKTIIDINEYDFNGEFRHIEVEYEIIGTYKRATYFDPPEYPEIEIISVIYKGKEIKNRLTGETLEQIEELLTQN